MKDTITIDINEWQEIPIPNVSLSNNDRKLTEQLSRSNIIEIIELRDGLNIKSTSYVGKIKFDNITIQITPKIPIDKLYILLKYAYNLDKLKIQMSDVDYNSESFSFQDLLIEQLIEEVYELVFRGLHRKYKRYNENLNTQRGRLNINKISRKPFIVNKIELPCIYYPRLKDNFINRVIKQGLLLSIKLTDDKNLKTRLRKLISIFDEEISDIILDSHTLKKLKRESNRLTNAYIPSITIIELLINFKGINLDDENNNINIKLNGFLFDMNHFFQTLLLRLLTDNLEQYTVKSEYKVNSFYKYDDLYNPKNRRTPTLRPDYMIFSDKNIISILDAKYIDLWDRTIDSKVLYQLTVYSLLYKDINRAIILYPSIGEKREQRINLNDVTLNGRESQIMIRYVDMEYLTELISNKSYQNKKKLIGYVNELVFY